MTRQQKGKEERSPSIVTEHIGKCWWPESFKDRATINAHCECVYVTRISLEKGCVNKMYQVNKFGHDRFRIQRIIFTDKRRILTRVCAYVQLFSNKMTSLTLTADPQHILPWWFSNVSRFLFRSSRRKRIAMAIGGCEWSRFASKHTVQYCCIVSTHKRARA